MGVLCRLQVYMDIGECGEALRAGTALNVYSERRVYSE